MTQDEIDARIDAIGVGLEAIRSGWPFLLGEIDRRIAELTQKLVSQNDEQTRGRIKALLEFKDLPSALQAERDGMSAALADEAAAN